MRVLFVCTGNTCRTPMAEAIARRFAAERGLEDIEFGSAGTSAWDGAPASDGAMLVGMEEGLDLNAHRARMLSREIIADADLVLVMSPHHRERVAALGGEAKTHLLTDFAARASTERAVMDPFGGDLEMYRATFAELVRELDLAFQRIVAEREAGGS